MHRKTCLKTLTAFDLPRATFNFPLVPLLTLLVGLSLLLAGGCGHSGGKQADSCKIRIGLIPTDDNVLFYVAQQEDLFAKAGLDVTFIDFTSAQERDMALQAKEIDGEITDLMTVALRQKAGVDVSILCLCLGAVPEEGPFYLVAGPKSGVVTPADLAGAEIGIAENTIVEYVAVRLLESAGIAPVDRKLTPVNKIPDRLEMVLNNSLAVGVFPEPMASYAVSRGAVLIMDDTQQDISQTAFFLTNALLKAWPDQTRTFMKVLDQARELYMADPEKYRSLITGRVKVPEGLAEIYHLPTVSPLQAPLKPNFDDVMNWMTEKGVLAQPYAYEDLVDSSFLP